MLVLSNLEVTGRGKTGARKGLFPVTNCSRLLFCGTFPRLHSNAVNRRDESPSCGAVNRFVLNVLTEESHAR